MVILRKKMFATYVSPINLAETRLNARNGIISTKDQAIIKVLDKYGVRVR